MELDFVASFHYALESLGTFRLCFLFLFNFGETLRR